MFVIKRRTEMKGVKGYEKPEMEITIFEQADVIVMSDFNSQKEYDGDWQN